MGQWQFKESIRGRALYSLPKARIERWIKEGRVQEYHLVWRPGFSCWRNVGETNEFSDLFPKLSSIKGIGPSRIKSLRGAKIRSVRELADADPDFLVEEVKGVGLEEARRWVNEARELAESK